MKKSSYNELSDDERKELAEAKAKRQEKIRAWQKFNTAFHKQYIKRHQE